MCQSQNVGSYEEAGEVNYTELQKGREDLRRKVQLQYLCFTQSYNKNYDGCAGA